MFKTIFILIGILVIASTDVEAQRRTRRRGHEKKRVPERYEPIKKIPKREPILFRFEVRPELFYHSLSMSDYNKFSDAMRKDTSLAKISPKFKQFPGLRSAIGVEFEGACFYQEMIGVGLGIGRIGKGVDFNASGLEKTETDSFKQEYKYQFHTSTIPLLLTLYYILPIPVVRVTTCIGTGLYITSATGKNYRCSELLGQEMYALTSYEISGKNLKGTGLGFHMGVRGDYPILKWLSVYVDTKIRIAKVCPLKGKVTMEGKEKVQLPWVREDTTWKETGDGKIWFYWEDGKEPYFSPLIDKKAEKKENWREGSVNFSGIKIGAGIMLRF